MTINISAIICTHNGQKVLRKAIQSLVDQTLDKKKYEIIVVDNASTDGSREITRQFETERNLRYFHEPKLGLSHARNTGWQQAEGEIIAYLDDDAVACPKWLERIVGVFADVPDAGVVGGRVEPIWEADPPPWINTFMQRFLSILDWSDIPITLGGEKYLVGANIAFPRKMLQEFSGFPTDLGRKGGNLISNEEIELIRMIKGKGRVVFYHPEISVKHLVPAARLNAKWFRKRWFAQGISDAVVYCRENVSAGREKRILALRLLKYILKKPHHLIIASFPSLFPHIMSNSDSYKSIVTLGYLYGLLKEMRNG